MRLRYLHLPRCGPLIDTTIVFGREDLITKTLDLPRRGSLNFLVGVNGSGKSSLLRALYHIFRSLKNNQFPGMPLTLAWDIALAQRTVTAILCVPEHRDEKAYFVALDRVSPDTGKVGWLQLTNDLKTEGESEKPGQAIERGDVVLGSYLQAHLPKRLVVYTSGADDLWVQIDHPILSPKYDEEGQYQTEDERPQGWNIEREWKEEQAIRISNVLNRYVSRWRGTAQALPSDRSISETFESLRAELAPLEAIRQRAGRVLDSGPLGDTYFRIDPQHLRFAGIVLGLWQAAKELHNCAGEQERETFRNTLVHQRGSNEAQDARRVLNEIDWFWPTHLSLTYRDADDRVNSQQRQELLCLVALADEVVAQPLGRLRAVLSLGPPERISLTEKLKDAGLVDIPSEVEVIAGRVDGCKTAAEAVLRVFSADQNIDSTPMDVFSRLRDWECSGLLEEITLTVKRLSRTEAADGELDDTIVTYDQLSDGEQMLLGRMGLLFLLRGQDGSLLLLDEPETHFNDVWKREIVEMVDMALLNSTDANVIISTHTSIALTDAFAAEVTVLDKTDDGITARGVSGGLFGTDPGEVTMNLFRADSSIGSRSVDLLDRLLKKEWKGKEDELEQILNVLGSSFHRAELRAILKQLRKDNDGST